METKIQCNVQYLICLPSQVKLYLYEEYNYVSKAAFASAAFRALAAVSGQYYFTAYFVCDCFRNIIRSDFNFIFNFNNAAQLPTRSNVNDSQADA